MCVLVCVRARAAGVHASASPFEALAERLNWMGASLETDPFGKALLESGIPKDTIMAWTKDPQATPDAGRARAYSHTRTSTDTETHAIIHTPLRMLTHARRRASAQTPTHAHPGARAHACAAAMPLPMALTPF
eukprot:6175718-Pleurochrysis_carterae.AAC.1